MKTPRIRYLYALIWFAVAISLLCVAGSLLHPFSMFALIGAGLCLWEAGHQYGNYRKLQRQRAQEEAVRGGVKFTSDHNHYRRQRALPGRKR